MPLRGIERRIVVCPDHNPVTILTELFRLTLASNRIRDCQFGIATRLQVERPTNLGWISGRGRDFRFLQRIRQTPGPSLSLSPGKTLLGSESDHHLILNGGYECLKLYIHLPYAFVRGKFICVFSSVFFTLIYLHFFLHVISISSKS
jgi:hypothetical protein